MERDVKFRGKRENGEWMYGCFIYPDVICGEIMDWKGEDGFITEFWNRVIPDTIGQFTGLYDKNDKEIYEGDIIETKNIYGDIFIDSVYWCDDHLTFMLKETIETISPDLRLYQNDDCKVIGNIYDNKKLLEKYDAKKRV